MRSLYTSFSKLSAIVAVVLLTTTVLFGSLAFAADPVYRTQNEYTILDEITAHRDAEQAIRDSLQTIVDDQYTAAAEARDEAALDLRVDWKKIKSPKKPEDFKQIWHNPPTPQFYTGTCWAFCSVSLMENEAKRIAGLEIKLSEMWVAYWEYVEKSREYIRTYGHSAVAQGGQDHGTVETFRKYGAVTREAYPGVIATDGRHDHTPMYKELMGYLKWVKSSKSWDEAINIANVRAILDKYMGAPPTAQQYQGRTYSPQSFLSDVLKLKMENYVACVSRMDTPFYTRVLLDVEDNWRRKDNYLNLPLHDFYEVVKKSIKDGYTLSIGGDNSEPGMDGKFDTAVVPEWDIPSKYINQGSREFRIVNKTTTDDHGVNVVGYKRLGGRDWYLIKDSNRSSRLGQYKGYYFWSGNYIRLKMLSFTVHKDRLKDLMD